MPDIIAPVGGVDLNIVRAPVLGAGDQQPARGRIIAFPR